MLTAEDLKVVLASPSLREAHGMELPEASLTTLAADQTAFTTFYTQWTQQGQPRYAPPATAASPAPAPTPVATVAAIPAAPPPPSPYGPPPTPLVAPQFSTYSRDPSVATAAFAGGPAAPPNSPNSNPAGANYLSSPNAVAPSGLARPGMGMMLWGFGVAIVGVIITAVTWATAAPGGTFVVAWGAIIFGTIRGIIGTVRMTRGR